MSNVHSFSRASAVFLHQFVKFRDSVRLPRVNTDYELRSAPAFDKRACALVECRLIIGDTDTPGSCCGCCVGRNGGRVLGTAGGAAHD